MTISSETRKSGPFLGTGAVSEYPFGFAVFSANDLLVVMADKVGAESTLVLNSGYTVNLNSDQNANPGGTVTLTTPLPADYLLVITSKIAALQPTDLTNQGGFYPQVVTRSLDRLTILVQQLKEQIGRAVKVPITAAFDATADALIARIIRAEVSASASASAAAAAYEYIGSFSVKEYGAVGDGVADDTAEIAAAIADASVSGGVVYFPPGTYRVAGAITISSNGVRLIGAGERSTSIIQTTVGADTFVFSSCQWSSIEAMRISHSGVATAGYAVKFNKTGSSGCFFCTAKNLFIEKMWNGIHVQSSTESRVSYVHLRGMLGTRGILFDGTGSGVNASYRAVLHDIVCDTAGNGNTAIKWVCHDSWAYSLVVSKVTGLYGGFAMVMQDTANTGSSYPVWCYADDLECDHNESGAVFLDRGEGFYCTHSWFGSTIAGSGVIIGANFRGEVSIGGTRVMGCAHNGVVLNAGPVAVRLHDNMIGDNGVASSGTYHGVVVAAGATKFSITNNKIGDLPGVAGNAQGYGIALLGGATADFTITGNDLTGNTTGSLLDSATGTTGVIRDNLGYIVAPADVTVTASPMVYRAGHTEETLFIKGGTVTAIQSPTGIVYYPGVTNVGVPLAPNQEAVIIYTAAPTMSKLPR